jgi:histone deacetylase 1/2
MKGFASELTASGRAISDIKLKEYLLAGLGKEYNGLVTSINTNPAITAAGVCNQLMSYNYRDEMLSESEPAPNVFTSSANDAARGRGSRHGHEVGYRSNNNYDGNNGGDHHGGVYNGGGRYQHRGRPPRRQDGPEGHRRQPSKGGRGRGRGNHTPSPHQDITCQICKKYGHPANECWWRYGDNDDDDYTSHDDKGAHLASYGIDTNWYIDTGATNHITGELSKLSTHEQYKRCDQVHNASGQGMAIKHIGQSILPTPHRSIHIRNILHVPSASKNFLSAHKIALDNNAFIEFHPSSFLLRIRPRSKSCLRGHAMAAYIHLFLLPPGITSTPSSHSSRPPPLGIAV